MEEVKIDEIIKEWNGMVQGFLDARSSWENLKFKRFELSNKDVLDPKVQRLLDRICATTRFAYAATSFIDLLGIRDDIEDLFIWKKVKKTKEINNEE